MRKNFQSFIIIGILFITGCASKGPAPTIGLVGKSYAINTVQVVKSENISYGRPSATGESQEPLVQKVIQSLQTNLEKEVLDRKQGKPAILRVYLNRVDLSSGAGRALLKSDSTLSGNVLLLDGHTKQIVAERSNIIVRDNSNKNRLDINGVPIGSLFALADNISQSSEEKRIASVVAPFIGETKYWLEK